MTTSLIGVGVELAALVAIPGALLLVANAVRSPRAPGWLDNEASAQALAFVLTGIACFIIAAAVAGLLDLGIGILRSVGAVAGLLLTSTVVVCVATAVAGRVRPSAAVRPAPVLQ